jgi:colicin import membrane protein
MRAVRHPIRMDSKSRWWNLLRVSRGNGAQAPESRRIGKPPQFLAAAGRDAPADSRRPAQPPREGHTWDALGLAIALHALLAAVLLLDLHRPNTLSDGGQKPSGPVERAVQRPLRAAGPPVLQQSAVLSATSGVSQLAAVRPHSPPAHHVKPRLLHPKRDVPLASHPSTVDRVALVPAAGASKAPASTSNEREHDARVAALQALADGGLLAGNPQLERQRNMATSPSYAGKVARRLRANVIAPFAIQGNPSAIVDVTCAPNGALLGATIRRSSGNPEWDRAVLSAVEKSAPMPVDDNGTAPASFTITFRPKG